MPIDFAGTTLSSTGINDLSIANGGNSWLRVAGPGRVAQDQAPVFQGMLSGQSANYRAANFGFGDIRINRGSCWNNTTGKFTCPTAGRYLVFMSGIASGNIQASPGYGYFSILKNNATYCFSHWNTASVWDACTISAIVNAVPGDTISYSINLTPGIDANNNVGWYGVGGHCSFGIALVK